VNHTFLPLVRTPGGRIVHIGSETHHLTLPFMPYPLTKNVLESYAKVLRQELRLNGIDVIIIRPGAIRTQFVKNLSNINYSISNIRLRSAFRKFTSSLHGEVGKVVSPEKAAEFIYRVSRIPNPNAIYRINNSLKLRIAARIPFSTMEKVMQKNYGNSFTDRDSDGTLNRKQLSKCHYAGVQDAGIRVCRRQKPFPSFL